MLRAARPGTCGWVRREGRGSGLEDPSGWERELGSGAGVGPAGRRGGKVLTHCPGVWKKRQEQRNWQHMGSRWYKSSSRMRTATMNTDVDTAAGGGTGGARG